MMYTLKARNPSRVFETLPESVPAALEFTRALSPIRIVVQFLKQRKVLESSFNSETVALWLLNRKDAVFLRHVCVGCMIETTLISLFDAPGVQHGWFCGSQANKRLY